MSSPWREEVYDALTELRLEVLTATDVPEPIRARILHQLVTVMERITYVRIRGFTGLYVSAYNTQHLVENLADEPPMQTIGVGDRLKGWGSRIGGGVKKLEQILAPPTAGTLAYIVTSDPGLAFGAYLGARSAVGSDVLGSRGELESGNRDSSAS